MTPNYTMTNNAFLIFGNRMLKSLPASVRCCLIIAGTLWNLCALGLAQETAVSKSTTNEWPADRAPEELKIATWNLEWFFDDFKANNRSDVAKEQSAPSRQEWDWRVANFAAAIAKFEPTILAVQEIEDRGVMQNLTKTLKEKFNLSYRVAFIEGFDSGTEQDVAVIFRSGLVELARREQNNSMFASKEFYNLSKHLITRFEWQNGQRVIPISILNLHLRATADAAELRQRQTKLAHQWMRKAIMQGENVIILGDLNVEETVGEVKPGGDGMHTLLGLDTPEQNDDLVDLLERAPAEKRRTHLILDKQFDRILASPTLVDGKGGYRLKGIEVLSQWNIRGTGPDEDHWDTRYTKDYAERDLSDHHPVMATFELVP
jgi:endonuclease/exonuclease/phosphatase family metal-dependent hydrolase